MRNVTITGFSIRKDLLKWIEAERGDISRSRFLSKIIEEQASRSDNPEKTFGTASQVGEPVGQSSIVKTKNTSHRSKD